MPGSTASPARRTGPGALGTLGGVCFRHRWLTLVAWVVGVACLVTLWTMFGAPAQNNFTGSDPGQTLLNQHFHRQSGDTLTLAIRSTAPVTSPATRGPDHQCPGPVRAGAARDRGDQPVCGPRADLGGRAHRVRHRPVQRPGCEHQQQRSARADERGQGGVRARGELLPGRRRGRPGGNPVRRGERRNRHPGRGYRAADRVRVADRHGAAGAHRGARHRRGPVPDRAARAHLPGPVVLPDRRVHDRAGRGRGLRAVHPHPVPRGAPQRPAADGRHGHRDAHRGPDRADRRHHGDHRDARAAGAAPVAAQRGGHRRRRHRRHGAARLADPAARAARLHRDPAGQAVPVPAPPLARRPVSPASLASRPGRMPPSAGRR